ncbi:hypothetical protein [Burkholderia alba]|uniref:hypothetical protein n=1 Tax=Burkholderia alba TaxID=2683677 RepID=UPI002B058D3E|nr:hypothetical protein [Burkholderia alba]
MMTIDKAAFAIMAVALSMVACSALPTSEVSLPVDATITAGRIVGKTHLTDVPIAPSGSGPTVGVGGGGGSGGFPNTSSGGFFGAGLSFDVSRLFGSRNETQTAPIYRNRIQLSKGTTRDIYSVLNVSAQQCVDVIDSGQSGYPRLKPADRCE